MRAWPKQGCSKMKMAGIIIGGLSMAVWIAPLAHAADHSCGDGPAALEVLGSGGPELGDGRASSGYLVWMDGKARILVDMGSGSMLNFEQSGPTCWSHITPSRKGRRALRVSCTCRHRRSGVSLLRPRSERLFCRIG